MTMTLALGVSPGPMIHDDQFCCPSEPLKDIGSPKKENKPLCPEGERVYQKKMLIILILQNPHQQRRGRLAKSQSTGLKRYFDCLINGNAMKIMF